eukprot:GHVS01060766.1.p2 GENE.GHVS01060766.1~~GHVS01060766.1.p2  ORF type:complete len:276 (-),score=47.73 GHVS01060766.1:3359-4186(-)
MRADRRCSVAPAHYSCPRLTRPTTATAYTLPTTGPADSRLARCSASSCSGSAISCVSCDGGGISRARAPVCSRAPLVPPYRCYSSTVTGGTDGNATNGEAEDGGARSRGHSGCGEWELPGVGGVERVASEGAISRELLEGLEVYIRQATEEERRVHEMHSVEVPPEYNRWLRGPEYYAGQPQRQPSPAYRQHQQQLYVQNQRWMHQTLYEEELQRQQPKQHFAEGAYQPYIQKQPVQQQLLQYIGQQPVNTEERWDERQHGELEEQRNLYFEDAE